MRRINRVLGIAGGILLLWFLVYQSLAIFNPSPLSPQPTLVGTSEVPTLEPVVIHISYDDLVAQVVPSAGKTIAVSWGDMGQRLLDVGAIDLARIEDLYGGLSAEQREILQGDGVQQITLTADNIQFWTNVLWAFGLTQQSKVLSEGPMSHNGSQTPLGNYASTGGWTIGSRDAVELYNSARLVDLTPEQDDLVYRMAERIFRPCCGNPTVYPDCNHGMAVLGLLELMVVQGANEQEMYQAALVFNSYAFPGSYIPLAAYFAARNIPWAEVDPATALGPDYSSGQGARQIAAQIGEIPGAPNQGGSCST